jgi:hypothetical protein
MKRLFAQAATVLMVGALTTATAALAQRASDSAAIEARASIAHMVVTPRSIGFGMAKKIETKSIRIKNTGTLDTNVTVVAPSPPFSITAGGGSYPLTPGQVQIVSVQFAPTAAGPVRQAMAIQCANCNTAADDIVVIDLSGNAKAPVPTPTATGPLPTPTATAPVPTPTATSATATPTATASPGTANALPFSVTAGAYDATDQPLASITVCATGTSNCTIVNDVLIDTGSFGLRIFGSQINGLGITPNTDHSSELGECAFFGSGSTWGSVSTVDVKIAGEPTITIPIQVMDDTNAFAPPPRDCTQGTQLLSSPSEVGFTGLLGVGQVSNDVIFTDYFDCSGGSCSLLDSPPDADIVPNPVSSFPVDNNGVVVSLPSIPAGGQQTTNGTLYFGIGTESNNQPGAVKTYSENSNPNSGDYLDIDTVYKGITAGGFFDTGSNGYFFNDSSINQCTDGSGFYCPAGTLSESATNKSVGGSVSDVVSFTVANADNLFNSNDAAFDNLGGSYDGGSEYDGFDWGLPFFFGRTVYLGIVGTSSSLGSGAYTAY